MPNGTKSLLNKVSSSLLKPAANMFMDLLQRNWLSALLTKFVASPLVTNLHSLWPRYVGHSTNQLLIKHEPQLVLQENPRDIIDDVLKNTRKSAMKLSVCAAPTASGSFAIWLAKYPLLDQIVNYNCSYIFFAQCLAFHSNWAQSRAYGYPLIWWHSLFHNKR